MEKFEGKSIFGGVAIGPIKIFENEAPLVRREKVEDAELEVLRFEKAKEQAIVELNELYEKALKEVGEANAAVFEIHVAMLEDDDFLDSIYHIIRGQQVNSEYAVAVTGDNFVAMFENMEEEYFRARSADVKDISDRVVHILQGVKKGIEIHQPAIVVAEDISPSETVSMDKSMVLSFVTELGSSTSHTAILARSMNIPALIGVKINESWNGKMAIVDGFEGILYIDPDEVTFTRLKAKQEEEKRKKELLQELKGKENITLDGRKINVYANIGSPADVASVLANDGGGVGLFRSEFIYLDKTDYPTEEEQFQAYRQVVENMAGKKVIVRTLDIGADKQVDYFHMPKEDNPAMGRRAIRICLEEPELFKTQLRALYRASVYGTLSIMYPMITSVNEVREIKKIVEEVKAELKSKEIPFKDVEQGIMIETPAAAMITDLLAEEVNFFSIGTNDLTQYTLAVDRQNASLDRYVDTHHPAVLRLIQMTIENGHKGGCWVGICGELGSDLTLTEQFVKMGVDELSVSASMILPVREKIRSVSSK